MSAELNRLLKHTRLNEVTGCLEWTGKLTEKGYGRCYCPTTKKMKRAHRAMWEALRGPIPDGVSVLHRCDNRKCVACEHLFLGTIGDNNSDRSMKGRTHRPHGERKYPREIIVRIRHSGKTGRELSALTGLSEPYISEIRGRKYRILE